MRTLMKVAFVVLLAFLFVFVFNDWIKNAATYTLIYGNVTYNVISVPVKAADNEAKKNNTKVSPSQQALLDFLEWLSKVDSNSCRRLYKTKTSSCHRYQDGNKNVCLDEPFLPVKRKCLIYSFGIGSDMTFDDAMAQYSNSCEIHMFDPTINLTVVKGDDVDRLMEVILFPNQHFHNFGVHGFITETYVNGILSKFLPFREIVRRLGHEDETIDYLKIDVEGAEWSTFGGMLERGLFSRVKQIGVEVHMKDVIFKPEKEWIPLIEERRWLVERLEQEGFRKAAFEWNFVDPYDKLPPNPVPMCAEILFVSA